MRTWQKYLFGLLIIPSLIFGGCAYIAPAYPGSDEAATIAQKAHAISDNLEQYIKDWMDGKAAAQLPDSLLPEGRDANITGYTLQKPEEIDPQTQWGVRPAQTVDFDKTLSLFPDPHATYLILPNMFLPFGSKVMIDGQFPHSRFFDIQSSPSFDPYSYRYGGDGGGVGVGDVPLVDADIKPLPGNTNPFLVGADRNATQRSYHVTFDMKAGNASKLNPAFNPPDYRAAGNTRVGGGIEYQGPWGDPQNKPLGNGTGQWDTGVLWVRYYAPDKNVDVLGGVSLPKVTYQLHDGRKFFIKADFSKWVAAGNATYKLQPSAPVEPNADQGSTVGWIKMWGIYRSIARGVINQNLGFLGPDYVSSTTRDFDKGVAGHGQDLAAPNNFEPSATTCTYINYLLRGMSLGEDKVLVITGTLPTTPATRDGQSTMTAAQARYFSLTSYDPSLSSTNGIGDVVTSVMDDEITTDSQGRYVLVYSRDTEHPTNATTQNGATWINWGPIAQQSFTLRWMSIGPDWKFAQSPTEDHLGWETDPSSPDYNPDLISKNDQSGFLNKYQPVFHYLSREQFEALGNNISADQIPAWQ